MTFDKSMLHGQLDELIQLPKRYMIRVVGHALIELGLLTEIECGWAECIMPSRAFLPDSDPEWRAQHRLQVTVDHVVGRDQGGNDHPDNIMLLHFGCNAAKGRHDYIDNGGREVIAEQVRERWKDPEQRAKLLATMTEGLNKPGVQERKGKKTSETWQKKTPEERRAIALRAWETRRRNEGEK